MKHGYFKCRGFAEKISLKMDGEISEEMEEFFSIEEPNEVEKCFDIKYEFGAPQWYDFNRPETDWEAKEAELWFESAGSYPPSRKPFPMFFDQIIMLSKAFYL